MQTCPFPEKNPQILKETESGTITVSVLEKWLISNTWGKHIKWIRRFPFIVIDLTLNYNYSHYELL